MKAKKAYSCSIMSLPTTVHEYIRNAETRLGCLRSPEARQYRSHGMYLVGTETPPWCGTRSPINLSGHERCVQQVR